uniref:C2 domain-containing protein n=1 Tax=Plectus sambesii TaxID=2011161 RepID=A0A914UZK0_9BILA
MQKVATSDYANSRSIYLSINNLQPGRYVVVPTTYAPREECDFMLRLYTSHSSNAHELTKHKPSEGMCRWACRRFDAVTRLTVIEADRLRVDKDKTINPYCIARSEQDMQRSRTIHKTCSPKWNWSVVFYRKNARQPIELELRDQNVLKDTFLGKAIIAGVVDNDCKRITVTLRDRNGADSGDNLGTLTVEIASYDDPVYL